MSPIAGLPGYFVDPDGVVWSTLRAGRKFDGQPRRVAIHRRKYGQRYCVVSLRADGGRGKVVARYVHRLVLETFVGPCPAGMQCLHGDRDTSNNRLDNLRWGTPVENQQDQVRHGTRAIGCRSHRAKLTADQVGRVFEMRLRGLSLAAIGREVGVSGSSVALILAGATYRDVSRCSTPSC